MFVQALDIFNAAIVSPIYYVMFTTLTITASAIMFKVTTARSFSWISISSLPTFTPNKLLLFYQDWSGQDSSSIISEVCGFITVLTGTIILHITREEEPSTGILHMCVCVCVYYIVKGGRISLNFMKKQKQKTCMIEEIWLTCCSRNHDLVRRRSI